MSNLNADLIRKRIEEIEESLSRLEKIKNIQKSEFISTKDLQDIASYRFLIAIEAALSLCYHISAKSLKKVPQEYAECFVILEEAGIIPEVLSGNLQKMAKFRNKLIHLYWEIDYTMVWDFIQENLDDLKKYITTIEELI